MATHSSEMNPIVAAATATNTITMMNRNYEQKQFQLTSMTNNVFTELNNNAVGSKELHWPDSFNNAILSLDKFNPHIYRSSLSHQSVIDDDDNGDDVSATNSNALSLATFNDDVLTTTIATAAAETIFFKDSSDPLNHLSNSSAASVTNGVVVVDSHLGLENVNNDYGNYKNFCESTFSSSSTLKVSGQQSLNIRCAGVDGDNNELLHKQQSFHTNIYYSSNDNNNSDFIKKMDHDNIIINNDQTVDGNCSAHLDNILNNGDETVPSLCNKQISSIPGPWPSLPLVGTSWQYFSLGNLYFSYYVCV